MIYDLSDKFQHSEASKLFNDASFFKKTIELREKKVNRTTKLNSALHLFFTFIANILNENGLMFRYEALKGMTLEMKYSCEIVKEYIWKPTQQRLFGTNSTKVLNSQQINEMVDIFVLYFGENYGINLEFPSQFSLYLKSLENEK